ncbi:hypothetical protein [Rhizobium sp. SL86]|uniref:hypothetical protein n=1 Tax=Rhizobium sp. SL86 TaxID=2995148 RepID=UPI0022726BD8|nr:hypothetical protein [Rhizobium sp. SL86]MCY1667873.1 hypothetical protein [Rhizobium sp. SL86]
MTKYETADLTQDLLDVLGEDGFFELVEAHAGVRIYVPADISRSDLPSTIGEDLAARLCKKYSGAYIRVPLAREFRARRYVEADLSVRDIAKRLGLTETGVDKLLKRTRKREPVRRPSRKDTRQMDLFQE